MEIPEQNQSPEISQKKHFSLWFLQTIGAIILVGLIALGLIWHRAYQNYQSGLEVVSKSQAEFEAKRAQRVKDSINSLQGYNEPFTATLTGYVEIEDWNCDPMGEEDEEKLCSYVFFTFTDSDSTDFRNYIAENGKSRNSFLRENGIGLGCLEDDKSKIHSENYSDGGLNENINENIIEGNMLKKLLSSSLSNQIGLQVTRLKSSPGHGAPACYSHFTDFKFIESAIPINTLGWQNYENESLGISFKYPPEMQVIPSHGPADPNGSRGVAIMDPKEEFDASIVAISIIKNTTIDKVRRTFTNQDQEKYEVNYGGLVWTMVSFKSEETNEMVIIALYQHGLDVYRIAADYHVRNDFSIMKAILSTFKFTQ